MKNILLLLFLASPCLAEEPIKLLYRGTYYPDARIIRIDDQRGIAQVILQGEFADDPASRKFKLTPVEIPVKTIPKPMVDEFRENPTKGLARLNALAEDLDKKRAELIKRIIDDPRHPVLIVGKVASKLSDTELIVKCVDRDEDGVPAAKGTIYLSEFPQAADLVDDDPVQALATINGQYAYKSPFGQKHVRSYKNAPPRK